MYGVRCVSVLPSFLKVSTIMSIWIIPIQHSFPFRFATQNCRLLIYLLEAPWQYLVQNRYSDIDLDGLLDISKWLLYQNFTFVLTSRPSPSGSKVTSSPIVILGWAGANRGSFLSFICYIQVSTKACVCFLCIFSTYTFQLPHPLP